MEIADIGEEIAQRILLWRDSAGGEREVRIRLGRPARFPDSDDMFCPIQIAGLGSDHPKYAGGVDAIQAIRLALRMLRVDLEALERELSGTFTWIGQRDWELD